MPTFGNTGDDNTHWGIFTGPGTINIGGNTGSNRSSGSGDDNSGGNTNNGSTLPCPRGFTRVYFPIVGWICIPIPGDGGGGDECPHCDDIVTLKETFTKKSTRNDMSDCASFIEGLPIMGGTDE